MPRRTALLVLLALALLPGAAQASVAYHDDGVPTAEGGGGNDAISARAEGNSIVFTDPAGIAVRDPEVEVCRQDSSTQVTCQGEGAILLGGDGNDTLRDEGVTRGFGARGGPGDDTIVANAVAAIIYGDDRNVRPTDGNDTITGSSAEVDGTGPEYDFTDLLNGGGGDDTINAGAGADHASGQAGNDTIDGGEGRDELDTTDLLTDDGGDAPGDEGNDTIRGGGGDDQINADKGRDVADAGVGDDYIRAVDMFLYEDDAAADTVVCGEGTDRVAAGANERLAVGCETLLVPIKCVPRNCSVKGTITGKKKGAKKATTVAKASMTASGSAGVVSFSLVKAPKLLGSSSKVSLTVAVRSKTATVFGGNFRFRLTR